MTIITRSTLPSDWFVSLIVCLTKINKKLPDVQSKIKGGTLYLDFLQCLSTLTHAMLFMLFWFLPIWIADRLRWHSCVFTPAYWAVINDRPKSHGMTTVSKDYGLSCSFGQNYIKGKHCRYHCDYDKKNNIQSRSLILYLKRNQILTWEPQNKDI